MKQYENYENTVAFTGEYETLAPGGYVCKILKVVCEDKDYGQLLRIGFDIAEGEQKDFYKRRFESAKQSNAEAKWPGMYYQTVKKDDLKFFKGFITAIENSNKGFKWDWDEQKLVGKLFGGVFGEEEYLNNAGEVKAITKCMQVRSTEKIKDAKIPPIKRVNNPASNPATNNSPLLDGFSDQLPF